MTADQLMTATGCPRLALAALWLPEIMLATAAYDINTPARQAAFFAQIGHESGGLRWTTEIWGPTPAQRTYEGRKDLGNVRPGDGPRYRGRGLIQTTGRANYVRVRDRMRSKFPGMNIPDFEAQPEALAVTRWAAMSAADYWDMQNLNAYADAGRFDAVCDLVNRGRVTTQVGDSNGYADRLALYEAAREILA